MAKEPERLSASQRSKIRRLSAPRELSPDEEGGELNIVPFLDIITNVLMFVLATVSVTFTATIDSFPPKRGGRGNCCRRLNPARRSIPRSCACLRQLRKCRRNRHWKPSACRRPA